MLAQEEVPSGNLPPIQRADKPEVHQAFINQFLHLLQAHLFVVEPMIPYTEGSTRRGSYDPVWIGVSDDAASFIPVRVLGKVQIASIGLCGPDIYGVQALYVEIPPR